MIKVALIVFVTSITSTEKIPETSITGFYEDLQACHKVMDGIKASLNTEDFNNNKKIRFLKMPIRQAHQEGHIYWACIKKTDYN